MALTQAQLENRKNFIGGSDANKIMGGDEEAILKLWKIKRGEEQDEDLSDVLPVQMGNWTEAFNVMWFEKTTGRKVTNQGDERMSWEQPFMACTLDGLTDDGDTIYEAKHVSAFAKEDEILDRYYPQLTHNMLVCGVEKAVLSVFFGNHKHQTFDVSLDTHYAAVLLGAEIKFWDCVKSGTPPVVIQAPVKVDPVRRVDMTGNNYWAAMVEQLKFNKAQHVLYEEAKDGLKKLVEPDVAVAFGYGVELKRDKKGSLRFKGD